MNVFAQLHYTYHTLQFANQIGGGQKGHKVLMVNVEVYPGSVEGWLAVDWKTAHESAGLLALKEVKGWAPLTEIEKKITALMDKVMLDFVRELVHHQKMQIKEVCCLRIAKSNCHLVLCICVHQYIVRLVCVHCSHTCLGKLQYQL